jgi:hypothetical protein
MVYWFMQTFLPYISFTNTATVLDYRRLGKQRVETKQILQVLDPSYNKRGWINHPAVRMWRGYEWALAEYGKTICREWIRRGYKDSLLPWFEQEQIKHLNKRNIFPPWMNGQFERSHRSNLLRKQPDHYRKFWPKLRDDLPYVWPI